VQQSAFLRQRPRGGLHVTAAFARRVVISVPATPPSNRTASRRVPRAAHARIIPSNFAPSMPASGRSVTHHRAGGPQSATSVSVLPSFSLLRCPANGV
jgi:hypothetical protein